MAARVLLTGAAAGVGHALLKRFAGRGEILATGVQPEKSTGSLLPAGTPYCQIDPNDPEKTSAMVIGALEQLGWDTLDLVVLSSEPEPATEPGRETTAEIRKTFDAGLSASALLAGALFPRLEKTGGKLVLVAGSADGNTEASHAASSAGLRGLGRALAAEWHGRIAVQTVYCRPARHNRHRLDDETAAALIEDAMRSGRTEIRLPRSRFLASWQSRRGRRK